MHPKKERTFVIIKPDGVQRALIGEIIQRFERTGLKLVAMRFGVADEKKFWEHYNKDDAWFLKKGTKIAEDKKAAGLPVAKEPMEFGKDIIRQLVNGVRLVPDSCVTEFWKRIPQRCASSNGFSEERK